MLWLTQNEINVNNTSSLIPCMLSNRQLGYEQFVEFSNHIFVIG